MARTTDAIYFKSNLDRGGFIENIRVRNVKVDSARSAIVKFEPDYKSESKQNYPTQFNDYFIENISANYSGQYGIDVKGFDAMPVTNVTLKNISIKKAETAYRVENARNVKFENVIINGDKVLVNSGGK